MQEHIEGMLVSFYRFKEFWRNLMDREAWTLPLLRLSIRLEKIYAYILIARSIFLSSIKQLLWIELVTRYLVNLYPELLLEIARDIGDHNVQAWVK